MPTAAAATVSDLISLGATLRRAEILEDQALCEEDFSRFFQGAWPSFDSAPYQTCWAIDALCDHLEGVTRGHIPRLLINFSPRCSKSSCASIAWPAWIWARSKISFVSGPQVQFLSGSYNSALSLTLSNRTRRLILSPWYQERWGDRFHLRVDQNTKSQYDNTRGGSRIVTSVKGGVLGKGGDVICVDDPHNTETEKKVESDADRRAAESWWKEISSTRLNNPKESAIVVVMQRLHQKDISGIILDSDEPFVHLMIPMEFDEARACVTVRLPQFDDPEPWRDPRTEQDELMWPERFGPAEVARMKDRLGIYFASGRLQQSPVPKGGAIIRRDWWQLWDNEIAKRYGLEWSANRKEFPHCELIVGSLDTAQKEKEENDYNAMTVWGIFLDKNKNRRAMLMFAWAKRLPLHGKIISAKPGEAKLQFKARQQKEWGLVEWVADTCKRYRVRRLLIEDKTRGHDVAAELRRQYRREDWGVELLPVVGDKVSRAHSVAPLFTDNAIFAPSTQWAEGTRGVITECEMFPKGEHDDQVDSTTQFLNWARERDLLQLAEESSAALEEEATFRGRDTTIAEQYGVS